MHKLSWVKKPQIALIAFRRIARWSLLAELCLCEWFPELKEFSCSSASYSRFDSCGIYPVKAVWVTGKADISRGRLLFSFDLSYCSEDFFLSAEPVRGLWFRGDPGCFKLDWAKPSFLSWYPMSFLILSKYSIWLLWAMFNMITPLKSFFLFFAYLLRFLSYMLA